MPIRQHKQLSRLAWLAQLRIVLCKEHNAMMMVAPGTCPNHRRRGHRRLHHAGTRYFAHPRRLGIALAIAPSPSPGPIHPAPAHLGHGQPARQEHASPVLDVYLSTTSNLPSASSTLTAGPHRATLSDGFQVVYWSSVGIKDSLREKKSPPPHPPSEE